MSQLSRFGAYTAGALHIRPNVTSTATAFPQPKPQPVRPSMELGSTKAFTVRHVLLVRTLQPPLSDRLSVKRGGSLEPSA